MQLLTLNFLIITVCGIWRPIEWTSFGAKLLYNIFTVVIVLSQYFMTITEFLDILFVVNNIDDFAANTLMFFSMMAVCCKTTIILTRRNEIINLVQSLLEKPHKPQNQDEVAIQTKFNEFIKSCSLRYSFLATCSVTGLTVGSIINILHGHLPYRIWLPWNYSMRMFYILAAHQMITLAFAATIDVGTETIVFGLFIQTCAQLEIFEDRLRKLIINKTSKYLGRTCSLKKEKTNISDYIHYHLSIYKYAKTVNVIFNEVLFCQFFGSILVLCTSVYFLSMHIKEPSAIIFILMYTICMFVQVFVYCWSGNEVILKSASTGEAVYRMDWTSLSITEKKELMMIMIRSNTPIKFTSSFLITMSLQSYGSILKTSYSAFNLLQK
ncbi:hypothetical protein PUN28_012114 [Cardiocondyla obscurior]|uniref:Odorant receptor n=2 Tax=Cardiocondyla obscurior TaxID=286306 RepID=A0AAW2FEF4_9HYME